MARKEMVWCLNGKCSMFERLIETKKRICGTCGMALTLPRITDMASDDAPELQRPLLLTNGASNEEVEDNSPFTFETKCDVKGCPVAPSSLILVPFGLFNSWVFLCKQIKTEWFAYLKGTVEENRVVIAEDGMYFPKQLVQAAHVSVEHGVIMEPDTVASVHSHVRMQASFSGEDEAHFNHPADLVVNAYGEVSGVVRRKLDCGRFQRVLCTVNVTDVQQELAYLEQLKNVMTAERETVVAGGHWYDARNRSEGSGDRGHNFSIVDKRRRFDESRRNSKLVDRPDDDKDDDLYSEWLRETGSSGRNGVYNLRDYEDLRR